MVDILKHYWYVHFRKSSESVEEYYRVLSRELAKFETGDGSEFSAVAHGADSNPIEIANLEPADDELYYCRPGLKDGCKYRLLLPHNTGRWGVHKDVDSGWLENWAVPWVLSDPSWGFWLPPKQTPIFVASNDTGASLTPKMYFDVVKYHIQKETNAQVIDRLNKREIPFTQLEIGGIATT